MANRQKIDPDILKGLYIGDIRAFYAKGGAGARLLRQVADLEFSLNPDEPMAIEKVAELAETGRNEAIQICQDLHQMMVGTFVVGRRGHPTRFHWKEMALSAVPEAIAPEPEDEAPSQPDPLPEKKCNGPMTIAEAKRRLASTLGINPDSIEIIIRA